MLVFSWSLRETSCGRLATGWFADFQGIGLRQEGPVGYDEGAMRFFGATFDPSGLYRFNAVMRWLVDVGMDFAAVHAHVERLQGAIPRRSLRNLLYRLCRWTGWSRRPARRAEISDLCFALGG